MMKISVIVPVYNASDYLPQCIASVLGQSYQDYEIILIDDGSTDDSGKLCDQYSKKYPGCVRAFHIPNSGPLYARICGIKVSTGDILVFLDSDDTLRLEALEIIEDSMRQGYDMVLFNGERSTAFPSKDIIYPFATRQVFEEKTKAELYFHTVSGTIPNSVCLKAVRRGCASFPVHYESLGKIKYGEDLLLSACFITNSDKICYLDEGLYHYRVRPGSAVHTFDIQRKDSVKTVHAELGKWIGRWNIPELQPLHDLRKVRGWLDILLMLMKNKAAMSRSEFRNELIRMAEDTYFMDAYSKADCSRLSLRYRILAACLAEKKYTQLCALSDVLGVIQILKYGR